jgi:hypothetical protein
MLSRGRSQELISDIIKEDTPARFKMLTVVLLRFQPRGWRREVS